ncbi:hypothetical protein L208DRAFT_1322580, partial [Tricholoma matsutake]
LSLPAILWSQPWTPTGSRFPEAITPDRLKECAYILATRGVDIDRLKIQGTDVKELVQSFNRALALVAQTNDFTDILAPGRDFVLHLAFQEFHDESTKWFLPCQDGHVAIASTPSTVPTSRSSARGPSSSARSQSLATLGALTSLLIINGIAPVPLSPVLLHYFIHQSNLNAIHPLFLGNWYPDLHQLIQNWLAIGHTGDPTPFESHFIMYHDMQPFSRASTYPAGMASASLRFSFIVLVNSLEGGLEFLFSALWMSNITCYKDLEPYLAVNTADTEVAEHFSSICPSMTFDSIITSFLSGSGIPCPNSFKEVQGQFSTLVDLSTIGEPCFRPKLLTWASTGSSSVNVNEIMNIVQVVLVDDDGLAYGLDPEVRSVMIAEGTISFKTCLREARVPISYLMRLHNLDSSPNREAHTFQEAVDHWLLCECLGAVGSHSIL